MATIGALIMVVVAALTFSSIKCSIIPIENIENIKNPVQASVYSATMSIGGLLPICLAIILIVIIALFISGSIHAFGGYE